jgi:hypothetical protein
MLRYRPRPKSGLLIVMGILSVVIGLGGLLYGCCNGAGVVITLTVASNTSPAREMLAALDADAPAWRYTRSLQPIMLTFMSVLLLIAAIGLFTRKRWARVLVIIYAVVSIPVHLIHAIYQVGAVIPALERFQSKQAAVGLPAPGSSMYAIQKAEHIFSAAVICLFSAAVLIVMVTPAASAALAPPEPIPDNEFDDEPDDDSDPDDNQSRT